MAEFNTQQDVMLPARWFNVELGEYIQSSDNVLRICRFHPELIPFCCIGLMESRKSSIIEDYVSKGGLEDTVSIK